MAGKQWDRNRIGPRFSPKLPTGYDDIADPANGEAVPRCYECGTPNGTERVLDFTLVLGGRAVGMERKCERCYIRRNPRDPRDGDPLRAA